MFFLAEKYTSVAKIKKKPLVRSVSNSRKQEAEQVMN